MCITINGRIYALLLPAGTILRFIGCIYVCIAGIVIDSNGISIVSIALAVLVLGLAILKA